MINQAPKKLSLSIFKSLKNQPKSGKFIKPQNTNLNIQIYTPMKYHNILRGKRDLRME